jgi:hypothetical protein
MDMAAFHTPVRMKASEKIASAKLGIINRFYHAAARFQPGMVF